MESLKIELAVPNSQQRATDSVGRIRPPPGEAAFREHPCNGRDATFAEQKNPPCTFAALRFPSRGQPQVVLSVSF